MILNESLAPGLSRVAPNERRLAGIQCRIFVKIPLMCAASARRRATTTFATSARSRPLSAGLRTFGEISPFSTFKARFDRMLPIKPKVGICLVELLGDMPDINLIGGVATNGTIAQRKRVRPHQAYDAPRGPRFLSGLSAKGGSLERTRLRSLKFPASSELTGNFRSYVANSGWNCRALARESGG